MKGTFQLALERNFDSILAKAQKDEEEDENEEESYA
jgi:hypothetical protein